MPKKKTAAKKKSTSKTKRGKKGGLSAVAISSGAALGAIAGAGVAAVMQETVRTKIAEAATGAVTGAREYAATMLEKGDKTAYNMHHKATEQLHKVTKPAKKTQ